MALCALNLRADSTRDYMDMVLSWKHFPNIIVYNYARGLALHGNRRQPGTFHSFEGLSVEPNVDNIISEYVLVEAPQGGGR